MELYDRFLTTADPEEQEALFKDLLEIAEEQFYVIGVAQEPEGYSVVQNSFHNVPGTIPEAYQFASPALTNPEQYFIEDSAQRSAP